MSNRFYSQHAVDGDQAHLEGAEAHHLAHVMRLGPGAEVVLFDGSGAEFLAQVRHVGRQRVDLDVLRRDVVDRELSFQLVLGVALPKGDRQRWLIEKATELGATRLVPLKTRRGVAQPAEAALERLQRGVIEAAKQCGRNRLMAIDEPRELCEFVQRAPATACRLIAHPGGGYLTARQAIAQRSADSPALILAIGPEGGFDEVELAAAAAAQWQRVELGPRILRIETAAVALISVAAATW